MTNKQPLVSVIMPVYNGQKYLRETINSVLSQTYDNWELIAVNDASSDGSKEIILSYADTRIRYFENEQNLGITGARNRAVELARGEYCAILDHDDIALPRRFEKQVKFLAGLPDYGLCGTWAKSTDGKVRFAFPTKNEMIKCSFLFHFPFIHSSVMARTDLLRRFPYRREFVLSEDYDVVSRISEIAKVANLKDCLTLFRVHAESAGERFRNYTAYAANRINQAAHLGFIPTEGELQLQYIFAQPKIRKAEIPDDFFPRMREFMQKLIRLNSTKGYYNQTGFRAYLRFRWILACHFLGRRDMLLKSGIGTLNPAVCFKLASLFLEKIS